jgi:hypothetical protein
MLDPIACLLQVDKDNAIFGHLCGVGCTGNSDEARGTNPFLSNNI